MVVGGVAIRTLVGVGVLGWRSDPSCFNFYSMLKCDKFGVAVPDDGA